MAMETVLGMAYAMGRTLVLPPHQKMYLLGKDDSGQRNAFSFEHFFHMERIHDEHVAFDIISMKEFLEIVMKGTFIDPTTGQPMFPPGNRTDWDGSSRGQIDKLNNWLRNNITNSVVLWDPEECLAVFPQSADPADLEEVKRVHADIMDTTGMPQFYDYIGKPNPVNASMKERMKENSAERTNLCIYDKPLQEAKWLHFPVMRSEVSFCRERVDLLVHQSLAFGHVSLNSNTFGFKNIMTGNRISIIGTFLCIFVLPRLETRFVDETIYS